MILQLNTQYYNVVQYIALYGIVLSCATLYCNGLQNVVLHCIQSHLFTFKYILFDSITSYCDTLTCIRLYYIMLHDNTFRYNMFYYIANHYCVSLQCMMLSRRAQIRNNVLHHITLLHTPLH